MKIVFLCGYFEKQYECEIMKQTRGNVEFSANEFQGRIINGLKNNNLDYKVISAPLINSFPNGYKKFGYKSFNESECRYVSFNNIWGVRNFSRAKNLKKALKPFIEDKSEKKLIIIYSPHTPFLDAAVYAKEKDKNIKLCLVVPDLPQYMNLNAKQSILYKIGKKFDIKKFYKLNKNIDSYVLLTEPMKDVLQVGDRPYIVKEGTVSEEKLIKLSKQKSYKQNSEIKYLTYTGKVNFQFGIKELIDDFKSIHDENLRLVICGEGDAVGYVEKEAAKDKRIEYKGQVLPAEAQEWMEKSDILINPRKGDGEYTKYSFPSKTIDYLLTGKPVIAYYLDGMPPVYNEFLITLNHRTLTEAIAIALNVNCEKNNELIERMKQLQSDVVVNEIMKENY